MVQSIDLHPDMTPEERIEAVARVSMKTPEHLKRWLQVPVLDQLLPVADMPHSPARPWHVPMWPGRLPY